MLYSTGGGNWFITSTAGAGGAAPAPSSAGAGRGPRTPGSAPAPAPTGGTSGDGRLNFETIEVRVDPRAEWKQIYEEAWRINHPQAADGGTLTTAGNLLFEGDVNGIFHAYAADTGKPLWSSDLQSDPMAGPVTYTVDGEQYVAVMPFVAALVPLAYYFQGVYRLRRGRSRVDDFFLVFIGTVVAVTEEGGSHRVTIRAGADIAPFIAPKGSVTVDGVSLTVNTVRDVEGEVEFGLNIIPHTWAVTTLGTIQVEQSVNIEIDVLARYLQRMEHYRASAR